MNDIRRTILWVIFAFSLVMLWDQWQVHNGRKATFFPSASTPAVTAASAPASSVPAASSALPATTAGASAVPATTPTEAAATAPAASQPRENIEVTTDVLKLVFDSEGGSVVRSEFLQHAEQGQPEQPVVLFDNSANRIYTAQSGLIGGPFPNHKTPMSFVGERQLAEGNNELVLRFESPEQGGVRLNKIYTLKRGSYLVEVRHEVVNASGQTVTPQLYVQLVRNNQQAPGGTAFYSTFTGPAFYTEAKKFQKVDFADIDKGKADFVTSSPDGWVAMVQHYFASAWLWPQPTQHENFARKVDNGLYAAGMIASVGAVEPGSTRATDARLFVGPQEEKVLEAIAPGLELVKDYGYFTILSKPLYWLLDKLYAVIGNWGWSIVALVLLLKILFYPLNAKAYASMAKMKAINPKITDMRERLKDSPQQMQQEMMRIYREEKVNPMGGCLPIMVQIPVFIALYWVLLSSVEMRGAPWALWVQDLSAKDPYYILPIIMTLTTLFQTALNPLPPDPMQAKLMWIMPLVFSVMFFLFPAGLVLYWITNNILTIAQQWLINTRMGVPPKFNLPKF
ncbi:membrane protein insertase YidC [Ottowia sp.]|uniref:membrane protein insertase YidC n=1 Tax=Ottowia sp. TaxID=1898956 RepID=UPI002CF392BD|nr:membrane protein insertase YidC [Ottowia sp.]HRN76140.1 membrane protein insertase YidC [Ottowia sp.]HRQ03446.1 membrane protein insertase YidC [Ottowia sp.]